MKDPYNFGFVSLTKNFKEKELEHGLIDPIQNFLLELGQGFAFVGRQVKLKFEDRDYSIDFLFYHYKLRCFIVGEIKGTSFSPEDIGQTNFYLSAVDILLKHPDDRPTIGMIFCKIKNNFTVEYALRGFKNPIGVATYKVTIVKSLTNDGRCL